MHNLSLVIVLDKALPTGSEAASHAPGPAEGIGSRLQLRVRSLTMHNACAGAYGVLATDVGVKGVSLDIEQPAQLPPSFPGSCCPSKGAAACSRLHGASACVRGAIHHLEALPENWLGTYAFGRLLTR